MTCAEVFSYALLLKGADRAENILALLEEAKQQQVKAALEQCQVMPVAALRQRWSEQRTADELAVAAGI